MDGACEEWTGTTVSSVRAALAQGESRVVLDSFNLLTTSLVSHCHGTSFPNGKMDGACEGQTGTAMGGVGAALGLGESRRTLVSAVLLTILPALHHLSLSDGGLADGIGWTRGADSALGQARDRVTSGFESKGSCGRILGGLSGSFGFFHEQVRSRLSNGDS
jgi:hypothetical protein